MVVVRLGGLVGEEVVVVADVTEEEEEDGVLLCEAGGEECDAGELRADIARSERAAIERHRRDDVAESECRVGVVWG